MILFFSSEGRHYKMFRAHSALIRCQLEIYEDKDLVACLYANICLLESGGKVKCLYAWKWRGILKFEFPIEFKLNFGCIERFLKKCLGTPRYLIVVSGGFSFLNKDIRRCFLRCLQVSSNSSLLFNIVFWSAVRITSFSVRHKTHARPPLEKACPLVLIDHFTL